ncbi:shikimate dehydrogenase [Saprospira grandis]|nr:shikimate dehydrogenase [Saprospira grandis]WBM75921.1 shikimate dehydrogenase [Saprospira grandis]
MDQLFSLPTNLIRMQLYGLLGKSLQHSFSPNYFNQKFAKAGLPAEYKAFPLDQIEALPELLAQYPNLKGLNVTIPYKQAVVPYLSVLAPTAVAVGAVNCIQFLPNGQLMGHNTDVMGFRLGLQELLGEGPALQALVLGHGGAARAVAHALELEEIPHKVVSRTPERWQLSYSDLSPELLEDYQLIVNTTPLGMYPNIDQAPSLPYEAIGPNHYLYDLVYNPAQTLFLQKGAEQGAKTLNGLPMLIGQAEKSWEIWNRDVVS